MTTQQIYELAIKMGIESDLRGKEKVKKYLERVKKKYEKIGKDEKEFFDKEKLSNPYSDTRVLVDNKKKQIKKVLVGIDMEGAELLLADKLGVDLVIAHHPEGRALADLHSVMDMQAQIFESYGVPINIAEGVMSSRISEVNRSILSVNHNRAVDMARLLKMDFICTHTTADNMAMDFIFKLMKKNNPEKVGDVFDILKGVDEYEEASKINAGPMIFSGNLGNSCGRIAIKFTGGTSSSPAIYEKLSQAGIGTIIGMHMGEEHKKEAEKYHINVVIAGHIATDSLGMNLYLDEVEKKGVEVIATSGLIRVKRSKK